MTVCLILQQLIGRYQPKLVGNRAEKMFSLQLLHPFVGEKCGYKVS